MIRTTSFCLSLLTALAATPAQAQQAFPQRDMLQAYAAFTAEQCPRVAASVETTRAEGDERKTLVIEQTYQMMCVCQPRKLEARLKSLTPAEATRPVTEQQFTAEASVHTIGPCMNEFMRELLSGKTCERMQAGGKPGKTTNFCACMKPEVQKFSDAEAIEIGTRFATYIPAARKAKAEGRELPDRTPLMDRIVAAMEKCGDFVFLAK